MKDYYEILEINESASIETIEKVHKLLIKKYHPDLQPQENKAEAEEVMKDINEAYEVLTDPSKKAKYDAELKEYKIQQIMDEIKQNNKEQYEQENMYDDNVYGDTQHSLQNQQVQQPFNVSDEEIRRQAQVYYDELYYQYLYRNGYIKEDFKTVAKRYLTLGLTVAVLLLILFIAYKIPYFNNMMGEFVNGNEILKMLLGGFFE